MKRSFTYFLTRGLNSVNAEAGFISLAYNLKRLINIMGVRDLVRLFKQVLPSLKLHFTIFGVIYRKRYYIMGLLN
ncbi:hypothetical protein [Natranaerobius trueperi]|uniref:hypothetical protein n=1 Tax=Natranaerobius trueperi TaxID=759412 RepID=UPI003B8362F2